MIPPYKERLESLIEYFEGELQRAGVKVELGKKATRSSIFSLDPDAVILATGSGPLRPRIKGIERGRVVDAQEALKSEGKPGGKTIVLGGGLLGCEIGEFLAGKGEKVVIVEVLDEIAKEAPVSLRWPLLDSLEKEERLEMLTGVKDEEIVDGGLALTDSEGRRRTIRADRIVTAVGARPDENLAKAIQNQFPEVYTVGDCVKPGRIWDATHEGYALGMNI